MAAVELRKQRWKKRAQAYLVKAPEAPKGVKPDDGTEVINIDMSKDPIGDPFGADKLVGLNGTIAW